MIWCNEQAGQFDDVTKLNMVCNNFGEAATNTRDQVISARRLIEPVALAPMFEENGKDEDAMKSDFLLVLPLHRS